IFGRGFQAPVAVSLANFVAFVQSVSATEVVVVPAIPLAANCATITGPITVTNINTGSTADTSFSFTYQAIPPQISSISVNHGPPGTPVTINGLQLPQNKTDAQVTFGGVPANVNSSTPTQMV